MAFRWGLVVVIALIEIYEFRKKESAEKSISLIEILMALAMSFIAVFTFFALTGILDSEYHLVDDHEVYTIGQMISKDGLWHTLLTTIQADLRIRYRITYFFIRVIQCYVIGDNFYIWHIMYGVFTALNISVAYIYARYRHQSVILSAIFPLTFLLGGKQAEVVWRLGPQENIGVLILLMTVVFLRYYYVKQSKLWLLVECVSVTLLSGVKESFLLLLPLLPFLLFVWEFEDSEKDFKDSLIRYFREHALYLIYVVFVFVAGLFIIVKVVGTNSIGYAGVDAGYGIREYYEGIMEIIRGSFSEYMKLLLLAIVFTVVGYALSTKKNKKLIITYILILVGVFGSLGEQLILHAKSGMGGRYLLPSTVIVCSFVYIGVNSLLTEHKWIRLAYCVLFSTFGIFICGGNIVSEATDYAVSGKEETEALNYIGDIYAQNEVVLVDIGYEKDYSTSVYLELKHGITRTYNVNYLGNSDGRFHDGYNGLNENPDSVYYGDVDICLTTRYNDAAAYYEAEKKMYKVKEFGNYLVYIKNDIG